MTQTIYRGSRSRPEEVGSLATPIKDVDAGSERPAAAVAEEGASGPCLTPERNGRAPRACPERAWRIAWSWPLETSQQPRYLLAAGDRCCVAGRYNSTLHDVEDGAQVARVPRGRGEGFLQPGGWLFLPDADGSLNAFDPADGAKRFWISLHMGGDFRRPYIACAGETLFVQGTERDAPHGSRRKPSLSSLEVWSLEEPRDVGPSGQLRPGVAEPVLFTTTRLLAATWRGGVVTVERDRLLRLSARLTPMAVAVGEFTPVALSLDEDGWAYLLVDEGKAAGGPRALWVLNPAGGRTLRMPLPAPLQGAHASPLVSVQHRITIRGGDRLLTLDARGELVWARPLSPQATSGAVALDDTVLVADGPELVAFDASGQRHVLFEAQEPLVTTPVLTVSGRILVATDATLHCLTPSEDATAPMDLVRSTR